MSQCKNTFFFSGNETFLKKKIYTTFRAIVLFLQKVKEQIEFRIDTYHVLFGQDLKFELSGHTFSEK